MTICHHIVIGTPRSGPLSSNQQPREWKDQSDMYRFIESGALLALLPPRCQRLRRPARGPAQASITAAQAPPGRAEEVPHARADARVGAGKRRCKWEYAVNVHNGPQGNVTHESEWWGAMSGRSNLRRSRLPRR